MHVAKDYIVGFVFEHSFYIFLKPALTFCWLNLRAKYGTEYKGDYRLDGGGTTRPLSTQRRNCRPACRRPFPVCSTALCVWLLAVQAAVARSALASLRVLYPRPSTRAASVWGRRTITHVRVHAVVPVAVRRWSYPLQKWPCGRADNPGCPSPIYSCGHLPSSLASHERISTPTTTHTERTSSGSNGAPRGSNGAPSGRR